MIYLVHCSITAPSEEFSHIKFSALLDASCPLQADEKLRLLLDNSETIQGIKSPHTIYLEALIEVNELPETGLIGYFEQTWLNPSDSAASDISVTLPDDPEHCQAYELGGEDGPNILLTRP